MNILFVCTYGRDRSATASELYGLVEGLSTDCGGVHQRAYRPLSLQVIEWAQLVVTFQEKHRSQLGARFGMLRLAEKRVVCLDIENRYEYGSPELQERIIKEMTLRAPDVPRPVIQGKFQRRLP